MNNVKKSVLACLALALCSFNPVEAKNRKDKDCCDPICGTYSCSITPAASITGLVQQGVVTFYCDGTVLFDTEPENPVTVFGGTTLQGNWKNCGSCTYQVVATGANSIFFAFPVRALMVATVEFQSGSCTIITITGKYTFFGFNDLCLTQSLPSLPIIPFTGKGCSLDSVCCSSPVAQ